MAKKRKIDNLTPDSTASEMEQALREPVEANPETEIEVPEVPEVIPPKEEPKPNAPEKAEAEVPAPVVEEPKIPEFDYKKGYEGLREWQTRNSQELAEMRKLLEKQVQDKQVAPVPQISQEQFDAWYNQDPINAQRWLAQQESEAKVKPVATKVEAIEQELKTFKLRSVVNGFRAQYKDFDTLADDIKTEIGRLPSSLSDNPETAPMVLENAYWAVKGRKGRQLEEAEITRTANAAALKAKAKKDLAVEGSGGVDLETKVDTSKMTSGELFAYLKEQGAVPD